MLWLPTDISLEPTPPLTSTAGARSRAVYDAVIDQFEVETSARYQPRDITGDNRDETFCNVFVGDVVRACGCTFPRMRCNDLPAWLARSGDWYEVNTAAAKMLANFGQPTFCLWANPIYAASGHVAIVRPTADVRESTRIAQAGARNMNRATLAAGFGGRPVRYFTHQ